MKIRGASALALCLALASAGLLPAQQARGVRDLVKRGLDDNFGEIQAAAQNLDPDDRQDVYDWAEKDALEQGLVGAGVNFLVGFGIGSYIIGDIEGGLAGTLMDLGAFAVLTTGYIIYYIPYYRALSSGNYEELANIDIRDPAAWQGSMALAFGFIIGGGILKSVSGIVQIISPFVFIERYNGKLAEALLLAGRAASAGTGLAILPSPGGGGAPAFGLRLAL